MPHPIVIRYDKTVFTDQLKRLLRRMPPHKTEWDPEPLQVFPPDRLMHANRKLNQRTGAALYDPFRRVNQYLVPDQRFSKLPVPAEYADAYWSREREARRVQCPESWVASRAKKPWLYDLNDDSYTKKFSFTDEEVLANARAQRW